MWLFAYSAKVIVLLETILTENKKYWMPREAVLYTVQK